MRKKASAKTEDGGGTTPKKRSDADDTPRQDVTQTKKERTPQDIPRAGRYFLHDDRASPARGGRGGRRAISSVRPAVDGGARVAR